MAEGLPARACPACQEGVPDAAKFCPECGARLGDDRPAGERRLVTVLFSDLSGFTSYSERTDPEEVQALADEAAVGMGEIVERHGGVVDKIIGDAVMAIFGAPVSHEDDAERAVRAAVEMNEFVEERRERFAGMPLSIGINTGEAMYAPVGADGRYTVIGDTVNTAARLQSAAARGTALVGEATYRATADAIDYEEVEPVAAKGKEVPVRAWRIVGVRGTPARRAARRARLTGRQAELDRLWELWERARTEGRPYVATVVGEPGMGKTRLVTELTERLGGATVPLWGRCLSYGEGITYWPVVEILKDAAAIQHDDDQETLRLKLDALLDGLGTDDLSELRTIAGAVSNLFGVPTTPRGTYQVGQISRGELHWGVRRLVELFARQAPVVLVVEDVHWAEPPLLDLVDDILDHVAAPVLLLMTARPELAERAPEFVAAGGNRRVVELGPLSPADAEALVADILGDGGLPAEVLARVGGNPLFLEETVRALADGGDPGAMPSTLHGLIDSRLDLLPDAEREALLLAAVAGKVFWTGALEHMARRAGLDPFLEELVGRGLLVSEPVSAVKGEREWGFPHDLVREVAYGRLPKGHRAELHARFAEWSKELPDAESEAAEVVAWHLEQACLLARDVPNVATPPPTLPAVSALTRAGDRADSHEGTKEAARFYERALDVAGERMPETVTELRFKRAGKLVALGELDSALPELEDVAGAAATVDRLDLRCRALVDLGTIEQDRGLAASARERLLEGERLAATVGDKALQVHAACAAAAFRAYYEGETEVAVKQLREAAHLADQIADIEPQALSRLHLGVLLTNAGRLAEADAALAECVEICRRMGTVRYEAYATAFLAQVRFYRGPRDEAEALAETALDWLARATHPHTEVQVRRTLALLALARGDVALARSRLEETAALARELGGFVVVSVNRWLAEVLLADGDVEGARVAAMTARLEASDEDGYSMSLVRLADGAVAAAEGKAELAAELFDAAVGFLTEAGLDLDAAEARISYGAALSRLGDSESARAQHELARAALTPMGADALLSGLP